MSENQDIRVWARANGEDLSDRGRIPVAIRERYAAAHNGHPAEPDELDEIDGNAPDFGMPPGDAEPGPEPSRDEPPVTGRVVPERKPEPVPRKRRGLLGREPRKPKVKTGHRRVSIENLVSSGWSIAAMALARNPRAIPVARILDMQSQVAGVIVDDMARGTMLDKVLQPFARAGEKAEKAFALVGPPVLVGAMTANPQLFPVLKPMLKMSMMSWLEISEPAMVKVQKRAENFAEKFGAIDLDGMIDALWADLPMATTPSPDEEEAIRRARGE